MSVNVKYWLWLQKALSEGAFIKQVIEDFGGAKQLYEANILEWKMSSSLTAKQVNKLEQTNINEVNEIIYTCEQNGWQIIDYEDEQYPQRLRDIPNPPAVLYVDGEMPDIDSLVSIAIVGTRKASEYSIKVAHIMSKGITQSGALVISGGALGVDSAAHKGALVAGGSTIAVLGCGLGTDYLKSNKSLRDAIRKNGALLTEFAPFTSASKITFPKRNRIISGLSLGVLVVEAGVKSGSLITANYALEQGRDVYAIPASVLSPDFAGTNKLIEDGAMVATKPEHIVAGYAERFSNINPSKIASIDELMKQEADDSANIPVEEDKYSFENLEKGRKKLQQIQQKQSNLHGNIKIVYDCIEEEYTHIDTIIEKTKLESREVISAITQLEILDMIKSASGKRYKLS